MEESDFFREATLRICGNLEIEEGLRSCLEVIAEFMPADRLYLERYEKDLSAMLIVARANKEKGEKMDVLLPLPEQSVKIMNQMINAILAGKLSPAVIINNTDAEPLTKDTLKMLDEPVSSILSLL